jgi:hypothetical protein
VISRNVKSRKQRSSAPFLGFSSLAELAAEALFSQGSCCLQSGSYTQNETPNMKNQNV